MSSFLLGTPLMSVYSVTLLCLTLCNPVDCSPHQAPCPWDFPGKNAGVGCHFLLLEH